MCVGQHQFSIDMAPTPKQLQRQVIVDTSTAQQYQILVVYGIYVSHRCQSMINQTLLMQDYLTIQVRGTFAPVIDVFLFNFGTRFVEFFSPSAWSVSG